MTEWIMKDEAIEAVERIARVRGEIFTATVSTEKVLDAIRSIPAPTPQSEEALVKEITTSIERCVFGGGNFDDNDEPLDLNLDQEQACEEAALAVLDTIRSHDCREVDELREVLRDVLNAPVAVADDGATVLDNLHIQRATRDLAARAERLAKVGT